MGRISKRDYIIWMLNYIIIVIVVFGAINSHPFTYIFFVPLKLWMLLKCIFISIERSHDIGKSGWFLLIPFYGLALIFCEGNVGPNEYGESPKKRVIKPITAEREKRNKHLGRFRRRDFVIVFASWIVILCFITSIAQYYKEISDLAGIILSLGAFIIYPILSIKRAHDVGLSGWYVLNPLSVFAWLLIKGEEGPNEYGEDPKNKDKKEEVEIKKEEESKPKESQSIIEDNDKKMYKLAMDYYQGNGVEQSYEKAVEQWKELADEGNAKAQYNLALCYYQGKGVEKNLEKAILYLEKSYKKGNEAAYSLLNKIKREQAEK